MFISSMVAIIVGPARISKQMLKLFSQKPEYRLISLLYIYTYNGSRNAKIWSLTLWEFLKFSLFLRAICIIVLYCIQAVFVM